MSNRDDDRPEKRRATGTPHAKPLTLHPLSFDQALRGLLNTPPPPEKRAAKEHKRKAKTSANS
jgi:hypothetical protein